MQLYIYIEEKMTNHIACKLHTVILTNTPTGTKPNIRKDKTTNHIACKLHTVILTTHAQVPNQIIRIKNMVDQA